MKILQNRDLVRLSKKPREGEKMSIKKQIEAPILANRPIAKNIYRLVLKSPYIAETSFPGQFIHIRVTDTTSHILRRPISLAGVDTAKGNCKIIYKIVGTGTKLLSQKKPGEILDIIGPLGKGFPINILEKKPIIIGGGVGIAPLLFLAEYIGDAKALVGFPTKDEIFGIKTFKNAGHDIRLYTDDGSYGKKGYPTDDLKTYISKNSLIFACGPKALLKKIGKISKQTKTPTYISLEERMACGVGACLGCSVKTPEGNYKKVCSDGPVFLIDDVIL